MKITKVNKHDSMIELHTEESEVLTFSYSDNTVKCSNGMKFRNPDVIEAFNEYSMYYFAALMEMILSGSEHINNETIAELHPHMFITGSTAYNIASNDLDIAVLTDHVSIQLNFPHLDKKSVVDTFSYRTGNMSNTGLLKTTQGVDLLLFDDESEFNLTKQVTEAMKELHWSQVVEKPTRLYNFWILHDMLRKGKSVEEAVSKIKESENLLSTVAYAVSQCNKVESYVLPILDKLKQLTQYGGFLYKDIVIKQTSDTTFMADVKDNKDTMPTLIEFTEEGIHVDHILTNTMSLNQLLTKVYFNLQVKVSNNASI